MSAVGDGDDVSEVDEVAVADDEQGNVVTANDSDGIKSGQIRASSS